MSDIHRGLPTYWPPCTSPQRPPRRCCLQSRGSPGGQDSLRPHGGCAQEMGPVPSTTQGAPPHGPDRSQDNQNFLRFLTLVDTQGDTGGKEWKYCSASSQGGLRGWNHEETNAGNTTPYTQDGTSCIRGPIAAFTHHSASEARQGPRQKPTGQRDTDTPLSVNKQTVTQKCSPTSQNLP